MRCVRIDHSYKMARIHKRSIDVGAQHSHAVIVWDADGILVGSMRRVFFDNVSSF